MMKKDIPDYIPETNNGQLLTTRLSVYSDSQAFYYWLGEGSVWFHNETRHLIRLDKKTNCHVYLGSCLVVWDSQYKEAEVTITKRGETPKNIKTSSESAWFKAAQELVKQW